MSLILTVTDQDYIMHSRLLKAPYQFILTIVLLGVYYRWFLAPVPSPHLDVASDTILWKTDLSLPALLYFHTADIWALKALLPSMVEVYI